MNFERFEHNLTDVIKEGQIKLGYDRHAVSLNYPLASLCSLMEISCGRDEMMQTVSDFSAYAESRLGKITVSEKNGIFTLVIPPQGAEYVHNNTDENEFIVRFIELFRDHHCSLDDIRALFESYSDKVVFKETDHDEFAYVVYFEDGVPDNFIYCISDDMGHMSYHRFTEEDYHSFGF